MYFNKNSLPVGIDYTASNAYMGEHSFGGQSLHMLSTAYPNPYQQVRGSIKIVFFWIDSRHWPLFLQLICLMNSLSIINRDMLIVVRFR